MSKTSNENYIVMAKDADTFIDDLRLCSTAIFLAAENSVATDISSKMTKAADCIEHLMWLMNMANLTHEEEGRIYRWDGCSYSPLFEGVGNKLYRREYESLDED